MTFLLVINDIVNDKKGHNFMNDKTYWFSGNFCLVWKKYWKSSSFFCQTGSATILDFYLKSRSQEVGCVLTFMKALVIHKGHNCDLFMNNTV